MYTKTDFLSVTDMRKDISNVMTTLKKDKVKIIFKNNKPTAFLIDFDYYSSKNENSDISFEELKGSESFLGTKQHQDLVFLMKKA